MTVTVRVRTNQSVDAATAFVDFDPTKLQVAAVTAGTELPIVILNQFDNQQGRINFAAGSFSAPYPASDFVLATITFTATSATDSTPLSFVTTSPWISDVTFGGDSVLAARENAAVTVLPFTIVGRAQPPGRPAPPHARWQIPVTVTLQNLAGGEPTSIASTLDTSGYFTLTSMTPGSYRIGVRGQNTLRTTLTTTVGIGINQVDFGLLRGGDSNGDNAVTLIDFSILATTFAKCTGSSGYDSRADFNGDACVTILDFSLLSANFSRSGDSSSLLQVAQMAPPTAHMRIAIEGRPRAIGDSFTAELSIDPGGAAVDGAAAYLRFDPTKVRVVQITSGGTLPQTMQQTFEPTTGRIAVAAGDLTAGHTERFVLARVEFVTLATGSTSLAFEREAPWQSEITAGGVSILASTTDATIALSPSVTSIYLPFITKR